jgi:hypothetical protein
VKKVKASQALFIKLGRKGAWEKECLANGAMRVSYRLIPDALCQNGKWNDITNLYVKNGEHQKEATRYSNELKSFYEAGLDTIWVTFHDRKLW